MIQFIIGGLILGIAAIALIFWLLDNCEMPGQKDVET